MAAGMSGSARPPVLEARDVVQVAFLLKEERGRGELRRFGGLRARPSLCWASSTSSGAAAWGIMGASTRVAYGEAAATGLERAWTAARLFTSTFWKLSIDIDTNGSLALVKCVY
jgi:hypothetical protein